MRSLYDKLEDKFGVYKDTNRPEEIRFNCPHCFDYKFHLYLNVKDFLGHCHKCKWSFHLSSILEGTFKTPKRRKKKTLAATNIDTSKFTPLEGEISDFANRARDYLKSRYIYDYSQIYLGVKDEWRGRIVFPVFENGKIVFGTGRSITGQEPRYRNFEGEKSHYIYRLEYTRNQPIIVLCEGCIDSLTVQGGIAIFGKSLSEVQEYKLREYIHPSTYIYIGLDSDALSDSIEIAHRLSPVFDKVSVMILPEGKDLNSLGNRWRQIKTVKATHRNLVKLKVELSEG